MNLKYKQLWMVEHVFRSAKSLLETRPIWHKCDETIRGHVFCSFLALVLRKELDDRLAEQGHKLEWEDVIRDLVNLQYAEVRAGRQAIPVAKRSPRHLWQSIRRGRRRATADRPTNRGLLTMSVYPATNDRAWCHAQIACA